MEITRTLSHAPSIQSTGASYEDVASVMRAMHVLRATRDRIPSIQGTNAESNFQPHSPAEYLHNLPSKHPDPFMNIDHPITYDSFLASGKKIAELDFELGRFYSDLRQIAMSARILQTLSAIRPCLAELGNALQANVLHILPHTLEVTEMSWMRGDCKVPDAGSERTDFLDEISDRDLIALTDQLRERLGELRTTFRPFPDLANGGIINVFSPLRRFLRSILIAADDYKTLRTPPARVAFYRLFAELGPAVAPLTHVINHITEFVLPSLQALQTNRLLQPQMLLGVATLLSGITATTLQMTVSLNNIHGTQATLVAVINLLWLASLMCSITCALNTLLSMVWLQSSYRTPDSLVPKLVEFWTVKSPNWLLLASAWIFALAMYLLPWVLLEKWARPVLIPLYALPIFIVSSAVFWMRQEQHSLVEISTSRQRLRSRWRKMVLLKKTLLLNYVPVLWRTTFDTTQSLGPTEDSITNQIVVNQPSDIESWQETASDQSGEHDASQSQPHGLPLRRRSTAISTRANQLRSVFRKVRNLVIFLGPMDQGGIDSAQNTQDAQTALPMVQRRDYANSKSVCSASVDLVCLSPTGEHLASYCSSNKRVTISPAQEPNGSPASFKLKHAPLKIDWSSSQQQILCQHSDWLEVWDVAGNLITKHNLSTLSVSSFPTAPNARSRFMCATFEEAEGEMGGALRVLDDHLRIKHTFPTGRFRISAMVGLPSKAIAVCVGRNDWGRDNLPQWSPGLHRLMVYNLKENGYPSVVAPLFGPVREITMSHDQTYFLVSYEEESRQVPQLWHMQMENLPDDGPIRMTPVQTYYPSEARSILQGSAQFCGESAQLIYSQDKDGGLHIWRRECHKELYHIKVGTTTRQLASITWSAQAKLAFCAGFRDGTIEYWSEGDHVDGLPLRQRLASISRREHHPLDTAPSSATA